ncbi:hypothetical protein Tco_0696139 [Tanacetum coccineum]
MAMVVIPMDGRTTDVINRFFEQGDTKVARPSIWPTRKAVKALQALSIQYGVFQSIYNYWKEQRQRWQETVLRRLQGILGALFGMCKELRTTTQAYLNIQKVTKAKLENVNIVFEIVKTQLACPCGYVAAPDCKFSAVDVDSLDTVSLQVASGECHNEKESAVGFLEAWKIPRVAPSAVSVEYLRKDQRCQDKVEVENGVRSSDDGVENESEKDDVDESKEEEERMQLRR